MFGPVIKCGHLLGGGVGGFKLQTSSPEEDHEMRLKAQEKASEGTLSSFTDFRSNFLLPK